MPTENRSSSTEIVSVPRELADRIQKRLDHAATAFKAAKPERDQLRALLDAPDSLVVPLTGPKEWLDSLRPAEQQQGEPPAYMAKVLKGSLAGELIQVASDAQLNPELYEGPFAVFRRAYPGEVERLRIDLAGMTKSYESLGAVYAGTQKGFENMRAQLVERDALLLDLLPWMERANEKSDDDIPELLRLRVALSASAAPIQDLPAEIDKQRHLKMLVAEELQNALDNCSVYRHHLDEALVLAEKVRDAIPGMKRKYLNDLIVYLYQNAKGDYPPACAESSAPVGRDEPAYMKDALRAFVGAAYPVAHQINKRGHNWSQAYLDEALVLARAALERNP